jgi:hypothetical protein
MINIKPNGSFRNNWGQGQFPVLKKVMLFFPVILPPVMVFYDPAGVLPLLFSFLLLMPSPIPSMS